MTKLFIIKPFILIIFTLLIVTFSSAQNPEFEHKVIAPDNCSQTRHINDFNNDGKGDILVIEGEFKPVQFAWYEYPDWNKHDINSEELQEFYYVADCSVIDVDHDGDQDIVFPDSHEDSKRVLWFENPLPAGKASETWTKHLISNLGNISWLKDIEVADFNNDGAPDVAVRGEDYLYVFYQNAPTLWKTISFPIKTHEGMASGDINRDGYVDIVLNGYWLKNPGKDISNVWHEYTFDPKWYNQNTGSWQDNNVQVRVADIDGNQHLDIVISNSEKPGYPVSWYKAPENPENETWIEHKIGQLDYCHTLQPGDFDNDGDIDVFAAEMKKESSAGRMILFLQEVSQKSSVSGKEKAIAWKEQIISNLGAYWAVTGDLGGDGDLDILSSRRFDMPPIEIWENKLSDKVESH